MNRPSKFLPSRAKAGAPVNVAGLMAALEKIEKALQYMEVQSTKGKSRIDWANGYPIIFVKEV